MDKSEINPTGMMCLATGLTDGFQCEIVKRKGKWCPKPSIATRAAGEHVNEKKGGSATFWICVPALLYKAHNGTDEPISFEETVDAQVKCDSFLPRK